jgi:hypothetical protein
VSSDKKEKLRYDRMGLKRMNNQIIKGSFECYVNADKVVACLVHVKEINEKNENITNLNHSINKILWSLNVEMRFNLKLKEK